MKFELNENQVKKYKKWLKNLPTKNYGAIGGGIHFIFTPTGIGNIIKVTRDDGYELDLTEVETW